MQTETNEKYSSEEGRRLEVTTTETPISQTKTGSFPHSELPTQEGRKTCAHTAAQPKTGSANQRQEVAQSHNTDTGTAQAAESAFPNDALHHKHTVTLKTIGRWSTL